jgi:outer membrane protein assembly factor BamA
MGDGVRGLIDLEAIGAEFVRFYGYGNETTSEPSASYKAERQELRLDAHLALAPSEHVQLRFGPSLLALRPEDHAGTLIDELRPYGYEDFESLSLTGSLSWNDVDDPVQPRHGSSVDIRAAWTPPLLSTEYAFGSLRAVGTTHLSADESAVRPSLALRVGAEKLWGTYPYHEAAYLGGASSVRGFRNHRFAGDGSVFGNAELRLFLTHFVFLLPGDLGIFGLADTGRVFLEGEESDEWHSSFGGGLWVDWVDAYSFNLALARSLEDTFFYFGLGFSF